MRGRPSLATLPLALLLLAPAVRAQPPGAAPPDPDRPAAEAPAPGAGGPAEGQDPAARTAAGSEGPTVRAGADGFALRSADGAFQLRLRGLLQTDGRFFPGDQDEALTDTFVIRRARPILEGTLFEIVEFRLMPDFGGGTAALLDAYLDLRFSPAFRLRAGKAKVPVGLEALLEDKDLPFVERGLPSGLAPVRDVGVQLQGAARDGRLLYAAGVFNGALDGASGDTDSTDAKELAARLVWRPFQRPAGQPPPPLGLGIGLAGSVGDQDGTVAAPALPTYRSPGQRQVFAYRADGTAAGTALAAGARRRLAPQAWLHAGRWFALAEWTQSEQEVARGASRATLTHVAWQVAGSWAVTGEAITERGAVPARPFALGADGGRGAVVLSLRLGELSLDRAAFPLFADPARAVRRATNLGGSLSWLLNRAVKLVVDYQHTGFEGGAAGGDRATERAVLARLQLAF